MNKQKQFIGRKVDPDWIRLQQKQFNVRKVDPDWIRLQQASIDRRNELSRQQFQVDTYPKLDIVIDFFIE
jgi:hypothetical protein